MEESNTENNYIKYRPTKSLERIEKIINESENSYEEIDEIPSRDELTYNNGFYINCSAVFIDIRRSSSLTDIHYRPKLAKLYRTFISEVVAIINGNIKCKEIDIIGDCVSAIFEASSKEDVTGVCCTAAQISSLIKIMNSNFKKNDISEVKIGIGVSSGKALMIKAGYDGSGIYDIVWMGDVVNEASKLCSYANKTELLYEMMISESIYKMLNQIIKNKFEYNFEHNCYQGNYACRIIEDCLNCAEIKDCEIVDKCDLYYTVVSDKSE